MCRGRDLIDVGKLAEIETRSEFIERCMVVAEALTWLGTKFHMNARVKGAGVDCGEFLIAVYSACGVMPDYRPKTYSPQWHLHNPKGPEIYLDEIRQFARQVDTPEVGDVVLFHFGRHYAHSGIVVDWPRVIHAPAANECPGGVQISDASKDSYLVRDVRKFPALFLSPWGQR